MSNPVDRTPCRALTQSGAPCKNSALPGEEYCRRHLRTANAANLHPLAGLELAGPEDAAQPVELEAAALAPAVHGAAEEGPVETVAEENIGPVTASAEEQAAASGEASSGEKQAWVEVWNPEVAAGSGYTPGGNGSYAPEEAGQGEILDAEMRGQLAAELDKLIERVKRMAGGYTPPPFSPQRLVSLIEQNLERFSPEIRLELLQKLRKTVTEDLLDVDTWKGVWYMLNYTLEYQTDMLKRRLTGEYETDPWGLDMEFLDAILPFFRFMYRTYWRVETTGLENIPEAGRALLVANHSGQLPWDGSMIALAVYDQHPAHRLIRTLYATWFPTLPFFSAMFTKAGQALATDENGIRLLEQDELVAVLPEGYKGVGKLFKDRYRLARFGRGGFVRMALKTQAQMIPVSVVGAEETYISLAKIPAIAKLIHFPYFPISLTFPWFGLLGFVPLPTKWYIDFGEPIPVDTYGAGAENNLVLVSQLTDQVRNVVQQMIYNRLEQRKSVFLG